MAATHPPIELGDVIDSTDAGYTSLAADLGKRWVLNGVEVILVQLTGSVTAATGTFLEWANPAVGTATVSGLADAAEVIANVAGCVPSALNGESLVSGDRVLLIRRGPALLASAGAYDAGDALAVHSTAGKLDDTTVAENTTVARAFAAASGADETNIGFVCLP